MILLTIAGLVAGCGGGGGGGDLTVTNTSGEVIQVSPTLSTITVEPPGATPVANGVDSATLTVTVRDVQGRPVANLAVSVQVSGTGNTLTQSASTTDVNGRASATLASTKAETKTCTGFVGNVEIPQTGQITFVAGPPARLAFQVPPSAVVQDTCMTPPVVVALLDAFGNPANTATNDVTLSLGQNPGSGSLIGVTAQAAVAGLATFDRISLDMPADGYTLNAAATGLQGATSTPFNVLSGIGPGCAGGLPTSPRVAFVQQPGATPAGQDFQVQVALQDSLGNTLTNRTDTITLALSTNPTGDTLQGTLTAAAVSGVATFSGLSLEKASTGYRLGATATRFAAATSDAFEIQPGAAHHLDLLVQPSNAQAGVAVTPGVQVALKDPFGNTRTQSSDAVTVALANNPGSATLAGTLSVAATQGVATFSDLSLNRPGVGYTLAVSATGYTGATTTGFDITPGAPDHLAFLVEPGQTEAGRAMDPAPKIALQDAFDNLVPSGGVTVTVALGTNPVGGTLSGDVAVATVDGVATFANLKINRMGSGYTLAATATGFGGDESAPFNVVPGAAANLEFSTQPPPGPTEAGAAFSAAVSVFDDQDNPIVGSTVPVTVALLHNTSGATLGGTLTVNAVGGVATFSDLTVDKTQGGYTLAATSPGLVGAESAAFAITHSTADRLVYTAEPQSTSAGSTFTASLALLDRFGNLVTSDSASVVTVALGVTPPGATLKGTLQKTLSSGAVTFGDLSLELVGSYTLMATTGAFQAESASFAIGSGAATRLVYTSVPSNVVAGQAFSASVQVRDAFDNPVAGYADPILLTLGGGNPDAPGTLTGTNPRTPTAGTAVFEDLRVDVFDARYTLTASSGALTTAVIDPLVVGLPSTPVTWYVDNTAAPGGIGISAYPFDTLAEAETASRSQDAIIVRLGDGTTNGYASGITLKTTQSLGGQGNPIIGPVVMAHDCTVQNLRVTGGAGTAVRNGAGATTGALLNVTATNSQTGFAFDGASGTWTLLDCDVDGVVTGPAISLVNNPTATFAFDGLTVRSGGGLVASGGGTLRATGTNSLTAIGAPALHLSDVAVGVGGLTFADLTSSDSTAAGVALTGLTGPGDFQVTGAVDVLRPSGSGVVVLNCPGKNFEFGSVQVTTGTFAGLDLATGNANSTFDFGSVTITNSGAAGVLATNANLHIGGGSVATTGAPCLDLNGTTLVNGGVTLASASSTDSTGRGMRLSGVIGGSALSIAGGALAGAAETAFDVQAGFANLTYGGTITNTTAAARAVDIAGRTSGTVTLNGAITDTGGTGGGVRVASHQPSATTIINGACNLATGAGVTALDVANLGGSVSFPNGNLTVAATGANGVAMKLAGTGMTTVSGAGNTLQATGGAVSFQASGSPSLDFHGNVTHGSTARAVDIQNTTAGAIRFLTGAVSAQGTSGGVFVNSCAGSVSFANLNLGNTSAMTASVPVTVTGGTGAVSLGQVALATSGNVRALSATDGTGTLSSTGGTVTTTTGAGVFVDGPVARTPLAVTLTRVSSNGAANGLVLRDVNGSFEVVGDGGGSANGTGGVIQNGTTGVLLERATGVKLRRMNLTGHTDFGLMGTLADTLTVHLVNISNCGNAVGDAGHYLLDPRGTSTIQGTVVTASTTGDQAGRIVESTGGGTQSRVDITGSTYQDTFTSATGSDALEARAATGGNLRVDIANSTFTNTRTNGLQFLAEGTGVGVVNVTGSTFTEMGVGLSLEAIGTSTLTFDVHDNPQIQAKSAWGTTLVNVFTATSATATGFIRNHPNLTGAGATVPFGQGIRLNTNDASRLVASVTNNTMQGVPQSGIQATSRGGTGRLDVTVSGNRVVNAPLYGVELLCQDTNTLYANVLNNNCSTAVTAAFRVRPADAGATIFLQGYTFTTDILTSLTNLWNANGNTPAGSVSTSGAGQVQAGTPTTP